MGLQNWSWVTVIVYTALLKPEVTSVRQLTSFQTDLFPDLAYFFLPAEIQRVFDFVTKVTPGFILYSISVELFIIITVSN